MMYKLYFLEQNIYWSGENVSYQKPIANCSLAILLVVLLQTPSPHWFGIALSPLPPWSHVSQAMRIGEEREERRISCGIPENFAIDSRLVTTLHQ